MERKGKIGFKTKIEKSKGQRIRGVEEERQGARDEMWFVRWVWEKGETGG